MFRLCRIIVNQKIYRKRRIGIDTTVVVRTQLVNLQHQVVQAGLNTFRESSEAALAAAQAQDLQEPEVQDNVLIRARLRNKHKLQRAQMMESFHAADEKLSHMLTQASDCDVEEQDGAVIDEMYCLLAEHEAQVSTILGIEHTNSTGSTTRAAQGHKKLEDRRAATAAKALTDASVDPVVDALVHTHASRARLVANDLWHTQCRKIKAANRFLKSEPRREPEEENKHDTTASVQEGVGCSSSLQRQQST
eukprot:COSAG02_NODE_15732_length_1145_cov_1.955067_1_plen_248_part_10